MTKQEFEILRSKQDLSDLHYPNHEIWSYCLFLGKFTDSKGKNYDLGVHHNTFSQDFCEFSDATVFGNEPHQYSSGFMDFDTIPNYIGNEPNTDNKTMMYWYQQHGFEAKIECWNRLQKLLQ